MEEVVGGSFYVYSRHVLAFLKDGRVDSRLEDALVDLNAERKKRE